MNKYRFKITCHYDNDGYNLKDLLEELFTMYLRGKGY